MNEKTRQNQLTPLTLHYCHVLVVDTQQNQHQQTED